MWLNLNLLGFLLLGLLLLTRRLLRRRLPALSIILPLSLVLLRELTFFPTTVSVIIPAFESAPFAIVATVVAPIVAVTILAAPIVVPPGLIALPAAAFGAALRLLPPFVAD